MLSYLLAGCAPTEPNKLDKLGTADVKVKDLTVRAWIANNDDERQKGLMFVMKDEMDPVAKGVERGMIFVFRSDQRHGFWMKNTHIDLDIAFIREDGRIGDVFTMAALDERNYTPKYPYRYALEVKAGTFREHGIKAGDTVTIPEDAKKGVK